VAALLRDHFDNWYRSPPEDQNAGPQARDWTLASTYEQFLTHLVPPGATHPPYPEKILRHLWHALEPVQHHQLVNADLLTAFSDPPTYAAFCTSLTGHRPGTAGGVSGLTYTMTKH
jgi:hypothetical protein